MKMIRNTYPIVLSASQMNILHQGLLENAYTQLSLAQGIKLYSLEEYRKAILPHLCVIANAQKTQVIGSAYRDDDMNRVWLVQTSSTTASLMIDGYPSVVSHLGLIYNDQANTISTSYQQSIVLAHL